ncbi:hypothetical protein DFH11DRAFT_1688303 [Phellopilus nigrolimitatus]|nr:hypothetical protein DFH11DRAFT_1688303 [Phellopilus nigrolimitatus]
MTGSLQSPLLSRSSSRLTAIARHLRTKHKVVVCRDLGTEALAVLRERDDLDVIVWPEDRKCERSWLLENVSGATGLIVMFGEPVDEELLNKAGPSLKVVSTMSVGYEHVSLPALSKRGVRLGYTPDVLTDAVADIAVMLALMASRNVKATTGLVHEGQWPNYTWSPFGFCGPQISSSLLPNIAAPSSSDLSTSPERTVGFLGFGRIAQATLARLIAFGVRRCIYTGNPSSASSPGSSARDDALAASLSLPAGSIARVSLEDLAARADVLFLLAPGGRATHHIVDEAFLRHMKRTAVLVNPARGTLVDSNALARALRDGWIWGAGLDVVEGEPQVGKEHPLVKEPRCVVLPHIGSATFETRTAMATLAARNVIAGVLGEEMPMELGLAGRS